MFNVCNIYNNVIGRERVFPVKHFDIIVFNSKHHLDRILKRNAW